MKRKTCFADFDRQEKISFGSYIPDGRKLLFAFGVSFACEAAQYTLRIGSADVTDLITNSAGALLGLALYQLGTKLLGSRTEKVFTVGALACTFLLLGLMLLLLCLG